MNSEKFEKGLEMLNTIDGKAGNKVLKSLEDIAPELGRYMIEYGFGEIYSRKGLELRTKEIAVISSLLTSGRIPQLKVHLHASLNVGVSKEEIIEIFILLSIYVGFPSVLNAVFALKEVLEERKEKGN